MTDSDRPQPVPQSPDDRLLDEFLERRGAVSQRWQASQAEVSAPAALDAAVHAAAADALRVDRRHAASRARLRRWRPPLAAAATLVLGVGLVRLAMNDPATRQQALAPLLPASTAAPAPPAGVPSPAAANREDAVDQNAAAPAQPESPTRSKRADIHDDQSKESRRDRPSATPAPAPSISAALDRAPISKAAAPADRAVQSASAAVPPPPAPVSIASPVSSAPAAAAPSSLLADPAPTKPAAAPAGLQARAAPGAPVLSAAAMKAIAGYPTWQPGHWLGLPVGSATRDDVLRKFGAADDEADTRTDQPLVDGRRRHRLLRYEGTADPRGVASVYIDADSQALASVTVTLKPALPLTEVLGQEALAGLTPILQPPGPIPCTAAPSPLPAGAALDPSRYPLSFLYPEKGLVLLLSTKDLVSEIAYYEQRCE